MGSKTSKFGRKYADLVDKFSEQIDSFLSDPSQDNVHNLRTAERRVESALNIIRRSSRNKGKFKRCRASCKTVFRSTTPIRDIDTISSRLSGHKSIPSVEAALSKLQSERKDLVITVVRAAKAMGKNSPLKLGPYQVSDAKVRRRKKKIVEKLNGKIRQEFPLILGDSRRIEELHELRKNCKKLRYTLEILPSEKEKNLIGVLRKWQTMLGDVRDNDITEQFIRENHLERDIEKIMADLQMVRDSKFRSFVQSAKVELVKPKSKFSVPLI